MGTHTYINSEPGLWTVGFYGPNGIWMPESDHDSVEDAARRVSYLNGGKSDAEPAAPDLLALVKEAQQTFRDIKERGYDCMIQAAVQMWSDRVNAIAKAERGGNE